MAYQLLSEVRNRNISARIQEDLDDWVRERPDSHFVLVNHDQNSKQVHFVFRENDIPFMYSYDDEPHVFYCESSLMNQWITESNRYASEQSNIVRSLNKSDVVYSMLFPPQEVEEEIEKRRLLIDQELVEIKKQPSPFIAKDIEDAALGCLLGGFVAESAGAALEMLHRAPTEQEVSNALAMSGRGFHRLSPGQLTDDGELTLALAHVLIDNPTLNKIAEKYVSWLTSGPIDIGGTVFKAVGCHNLVDWKPKIRQQGLGLTVVECAKKRNETSLSNGCLMRAVPLAIWGHKLPIEQLKEFSYLETSLTNPNLITQEAVMAYRLAIVHLINHLGDYKGAFAKVESWVRENASSEVISWLESAKNNVPCSYYPETGHIKISFIHSFRHLLLQTDYYDALHETFLGGGDTDTNGIIIGALLGTCYGVYRIPQTMRNVVISCSTCQNGKRAPRPSWMLAQQAPQVAKELLKTAPSEINMEYIKTN